MPADGLGSRAERQGRRPLDGEAVDARADRRKGDRPQAVLMRLFERVSVGVGQQAGFALVAVAPDGATGTQLRK